MKMNRTAVAALSLSCLNVLPACGEVAGSDEPGQPLAVLHGTLTSTAPVQVQGRFALAMVWGQDTVSGYAASAQSAEVESVFPSEFRIVLRDPPPAEAMDSGARRRELSVEEACREWYQPGPEVADSQRVELAACMASLSQRMEAESEEEGCGDLPEADRANCFELYTDLEDLDSVFPVSTRFTSGRLVAYDDLNGNGRLDFIAAGANQSPDRLLWEDRTYRYLWVEGEPVLGMMPGLTALELSCREGYDMECSRTLAQDEPLVLVMDGAPANERLLCAETLGHGIHESFSASDQDAENGFPAGGWCIFGGTVYQAPTVCSANDPEAGPCGATTCIDVEYRVVDESAPAPGWPCPISGMSDDAP
jgi:hypothetical protein